jgi:hypothetical protein
MPAERAPDRTGVLAGLAAAGLVVCCGLPVLLSAAAGVAIAGVGLRSWLVVAAGSVVVGAGMWSVGHRRHCDKPARRGRGVLSVAPRPIARSEMQRLIATGAQLAEVLPPDEYDEEHLPGAIRLPLKSLTAEAAAQVLERGRPIVVYCWDAL